MTTNQDRLLTVQEVAEILKVPVSWVYEHTRADCLEPLPCLKIGKYLRFLETDIFNYLQEKRVGAHGKY